ncbi:chorismate mutase [Treponema phagedenis]|uniref:chorismate mutase n=1 Tax=Treponema phagedenis TaxID=162 RepID=A0A0B7GZ85_TREPH|nr:chorismate mutase [Treponema phagedenis]EFW36527.1 chorismate mutase [Treponema phagedenis F0421]NVP24806.1 chorismate mutase [Treponema phagedenis]QEJ95915.1 chorismate mutase [Treponema phagedenis]QEJ98919.1 chorismate mutase [Treponema phagedenis]QEK00388.1 chorismate mutase [Treponema phagedenis]
MFFKKLFAVRGAVCCENAKDDIEEKVSSLYKEILSKNRIKERDIISIQFTVTDDLDALNPAAALRRRKFATNIPLFCACEPEYPESLKKTIRVLIHFYGKQKPSPIYIFGAEVLRPDIFATKDLHHDT